MVLYKWRATLSVCYARISRWKEGITLDEQVAIFIDGSNLYHALEENCHRADLDFAKFSRKLCEGRRLLRTYYYNIQQDAARNPDGFRDQQKFLDALHNIPYLDVRLGGTKQREGVVIERGVDIMLATDLLRFAWLDLYDVAVLVSGDGDFAYVARTVKDMGKHVEVVAFSSNASRELLNATDRHIPLSPGFFRDLWINQPQRGQQRSQQRGADEQRAVHEQQPQQPAVGGYVRAAWRGRRRGGRGTGPRISGQPSPPPSDVEPPTDAPDMGPDPRPDAFDQTGSIDEPQDTR